MALAGRILQANLNHSVKAQDLLLQTMDEHGLGLAVVAEPYRTPLSNRVSDITDTVAVIRVGYADSPAIITVRRGQGFVVTAWGGMLIVGVYESPNVHTESLRRLLDEIRSNIAPLMAQNVLVLGDFNAKSVLWGSPRTNARGEAVAEWAAELDMRLINEGSRSTCVRWQGESIVDLTWASPSAARKVRSWEVTVDLETLSDTI